MATQRSYYTDTKQLYTAIKLFDTDLEKLYEALDEISKHQDKLPEVTNRSEPVFLKFDQYPKEQQPIAQMLKFRLINEYPFLNFRTEKELGIQEIFSQVCESYAKADGVYRDLEPGALYIQREFNEKAREIIHNMKTEKGSEMGLGFLLFFALHGAYRTVLVEKE